MGLWQDCSAGASFLALLGFSCVLGSQAKEQREAIICQVEEMGRKFWEDGVCQKWLSRADPATKQASLHCIAAQSDFSS